MSRGSFNLVRGRDGCPRLYASVDAMAPRCCPHGRTGSRERRARRRPAPRWGLAGALASRSLCSLNTHPFPHTQVPLLGIRPRPSEEEGYRGVAAPKRKRVEEEPTVVEIPKVRAEESGWGGRCVGGGTRTTLGNRVRRHGVRASWSGWGARLAQAPVPQRLILGGRRVFWVCSHGLHSRCRGPPVSPGLAG